MYPTIIKTELALERLQAAENLLKDGELSTDSVQHVRHIITGEFCGSRQGVIGNIAESVLHSPTNLKHIALAELFACMCALAVDEETARYLAELAKHETVKSVLQNWGNK